VSPQRLAALQTASGAAQAAGLWFEDSAHVIDPGGAVQAFARAACERGAQLLRSQVRGLGVRGAQIEIHEASGTRLVDAVVVCSGMSAAPMLARFGLNSPLQAVRGYHVELAGQVPFFDAPLLHTDEHVLVTPMAGRLRASSYMEFAAEAEPPDVRKPADLRRKLRALGYVCEPDGPSWVGARHTSAAPVAAAVSHPCQE